MRCDRTEIVILSVTSIFILKQSSQQSINNKGCILSGVLELIGIYLVALSIQGSTIFAHNRLLQIIVVLLLAALPFIALVTTILFFANRLRRKISQPVNELMQAVEKIRLQDLNFSINYQGRNELGDLCHAFNQLRGELQESLEREWGKEESRGD